MDVGTTWVYESMHSTVSFMKSKCRSSISDENVEHYRCKIHIGFQTLGKRM